MKKIGIISELNMSNSNYGNRLQAYALNSYINNNFDYRAESIYLEKYDKKKITKIYIMDYINRVKNKFIKKNINNSYFQKRISNCNKFSKNNTVLSFKALSWNDLLNSDYEYFITGSDVVWAQHRGEINRIRFLNFKNRNNAKKISYAASFGNDWIPKENIKHIKKYLKDFSFITVREASSVKMLKNIGIQNVEHVCDPTLLLSANDWTKIEKEVEVKEKYIFTYLLGKNKELRKEIKELSKKLNLKIVNIPHSDGIVSDVDENFADYNIDDCSPEQWIWLIHNAEYIITDSFHGCVFSTIFSKKFLVTNRDYTININNRMIDYLKQIDEIDKFVEISKISEIEKFNWDYKKINNKISLLINKSRTYLNKVLNSK